MIGDPGLSDVDWFTIKKNSKTGNTELLFFDGNNQWPTGEVLAPKTLREKFGGLNTVKNFLGIDTPPVLERSISAASKLKSELPTDLQMDSIPLKELSSLVQDIHVKTREASQNTDLDMRELLGIDKALQSMQGKLLNKIDKLINEIDW